MKAAKLILSFGQVPYLYVYGWAFMTLAGYAGIEITLLQGVLFDLIFSLAMPTGVGHHAAKTYYNTLPLKPLTEDGHEVLVKVAWYLNPFVMVAVGWVFKWALS